MRMRGLVYITFSADVEQENLKDILQEIKDTSSVDENAHVEWVHALYGPTDAIASVVSAGDNYLQEFNEVVFDIRSVRGVAGTDTRITMQSVE